MPDPPTPGQPIEAVWGDEVVAALVAATNTLAGLIPIGFVAAFGGETEPANWLFCRGQAVSTTTYSALYAVVGDRFLQGQLPVSPGQFRVPNMQARYPVGRSTSGAWSGGVGEFAGSYTPVAPAHVHTVPNHQHPIDFFSGPQNADHHHWDAGYGRFAYDTTGAAIPGPDSRDFHTGSGWGGGVAFTSQLSFTSNTGGQLAGEVHYHRVIGTSQGADRDLTSGTAGSSGALQIPPGVSMNFIIRAH